MQNGSDVNYLLSDHLGSTNGLANSSGAISSQTSYDSFGNPTSNIDTRYQFTGREKDDVTDLYYYRARQYDSKLGRFISEDPIGFAGGDVNLYGYVGNNPTNKVDPLGLDDADIAFRETQEYKDLEKLGYKIWNDCETVCNQCNSIPNHKPEWDINSDIRTARNGSWNPWWFKRQVQTVRQGKSGPWDYKMQGGYISGSSPPKRTYDDYGNFTYGATCRAYGFTEYICRNEAGLAQNAEDDPNPGAGEPGYRISYFLPIPGLRGWGDYGDDSNDQNLINQGMKYYDSFNKKQKCGC